MTMTMTMTMCWGKNRGPQWPHSNPALLGPPVEQDQGDRLVSKLVYFSASLNRQLEHIDKQTIKGSYRKVSP